ncbi:hypothetical protein DRF65_14255 [Chryseobacterium pennae]|uniref:DUF2931 family protein n=1 Tax=Chryseobacterium pennae TaxID=2258962 RepID=A0A3D9C7R2_9FLAO|nr:DUF2931 family protein [Chryseobacterium pennae]REC61616.1 hypothetical protein DRF65_14255 [Chryseobacterium pennae]
MIFKSIISAILVTILSLAGMLCTQNADLNLVYAALFCSPYFILITLFYFCFNGIRRKLNLLDQPNIIFELAYGFIFYLTSCVLLPVLLFVSTLGDEYEHKLYADLGDLISEMFPIILILSIFLTVFSSILITWAIRSYKTLLPVIIIYIVVISIVYNIVQHNERQETVASTGNIKATGEGWRGSMSNPDAYPVQLYKGIFLLSNNERYEFTFNEGNTVNYGAKWGEDGGNTNKKTMSLPKELDLTWYSFAEDCFYRLNSPIDYNKLQMLFNTPYTEQIGKRKTQENYNSVIMGFAPGGILVVWAGSSGRRQIEIGRYSAEKVNITKPVIDGEGLKYGDVFNQEWRKKVLTDTTIIPFKTQQHTKNKPIPYGYWDKLRTRYNWCPTFVVSPEIKISDADFRFYNAERFVFFDETLQNNIYEERGIPKNVYIKWYDKNGNRCAVDFEFNEEKTFKQFDSFFNHQKNTKATIEFNISQKDKTATAMLRNGKNQLLLLQTNMIEYDKN